MIIRIAKIIKIFALPILIFILHTIMDFYDVYVRFEWLDIPMHFFGGIFIGYSFTWFLKNLQRNGYIGVMYNVIFFVFVMGLVALTIIFWEFYEFILDLIDYGTRQTNLLDTMQDMFLGLFGGLLGYSCFWYFKKKI